ncbi:heat shock protein Hsp90 [Schizophyllum commune H4-8]|uniref:Histidine kinase/HSP90-like ATPase domain-containing protein n=1 Tax=Schizophyllum commune (strain H4-8 / FGSC 9210) TaxID=578458 RepID=D8PNZ3_SCHCM|nr:heat shock protein Hsp90 [Schizophyllum commune H4-8]KAI5893308.1 heat shock protein Hsp90 [Schizophyllum commune H4-8]
MRILPFLLSAAAVVSSVWADTGAEKYNYQSDVARMRKIVINSLYSHNEIFLRELISNANDAIEKLRLTALTNKDLQVTEPLNITIVPDLEKKTLTITDTGIGMTADELRDNLGTLAKSGTSEFLAKAESTDTTGRGNLIGAFGLGFYSSFLVADKVEVASRPPPSAKNPNPKQHVFASAADDSSFEIYPDPRDVTLAHGTEITLHLKDDALEYLKHDKIVDLVQKHSSYSSSFPIFLHRVRVEEVPVEEEDEPVLKDQTTPEDEDEAILEDEEVKEPKTPETKMVSVEEWIHLNSQQPIWQRDPKEISDEEYKEFYKAFFKDSEEPMAWDHFSGEAGSGVNFKAIVYLPSKITEEFWQQPLEARGKDTKLLVKRTFITSDFGEHALPKWASWVKVVVDAEDLPLNVSRETLQHSVFLRQLRSIILKHIIGLFAKRAAIEDHDNEEFRKFYDTYGSILKLGAVEDAKNREKLAALVRFTTNQREFVSLDDYIENKRQGQKQIFYLAEMGRRTEDLAKSVFVEKLHARGYEVLLMVEPLDEILVQNMRTYNKLRFQDVAKSGLKFGDEEDEEEEKAKLQELKERFKPLTDYLRREARDAVRDVVITNRLVTSPCAVVADSFGYTANIQRLMSAQASHAKDKDPMLELAMKAKTLEINPRSPLIEGLLRRVEALGDEPDPEEEEELREVASILIDGALVRSGFDVPDSNEFFSRVDRVLRRSLGVSESAPTDDSVKSAPPVDPELPVEEEPEFDMSMFGTPKVMGEEDGVPGIQLPDELKDKVHIEMEEVDEEGNVVEKAQHDEL